MAASAFSSRATCSARRFEPFERRQDAGPVVGRARLETRKQKGQDEEPHLLGVGEAGAVDAAERVDGHAPRRIPRDEHLREGRGVSD